MRRDVILADSCATSPWLTTIDVAKMLGVTTRWIRWLARQRRLPYEVTHNGQRLFRRDQIRTIANRGAEGRLRSRADVLKVIRPQMLRVDLGPRQTRLRLTAATADERVDPLAAAKPRRLSSKTA